MGFGLLLYLATRAFTSADKRPDVHARNAIWVPPWLIGMTVIGYFGRYGNGAQLDLPDWWDLVVVIAFSLAIFYWAITLCVDTECVSQAVSAEEDEIRSAPELSVECLLQRFFVELGYCPFRA